MEGILKKVAQINNVEAIVQAMQGSIDPWLQAQKWVNEMVNSKKLNRHKAKYVLMYAAGWIAEQYKCLFQQNQKLEEELQFFKAEVGNLKFLTQQAAAFSDESRHIANENRELHNEITFLRECLSDAQADIREMCSKRTKVDHSQCLAEIVSLKKQCEATSMADNIGFVAAAETDSGVETESRSGLLEEKKVTVSVDVVNEVNHGACSSDSESVRSYNSSNGNMSRSSCGQSRGSRRPALRCFVCQKFGHIARYCYMNNKSKQRNSRSPRTTPRLNEVYSVRWGNAPRHVGQHHPNQASVKRQISRLRSENYQLKRERCNFMQQVQELKMEMASFMQKYHADVNNSLVIKP